MTTFQNKVKEEGIGDSFTVIDQTGQVSELNLNEGHNISDLNLETIDSLSNHTEESEFKTEPNNYQNTSLFTSDEIFEIEDDDEPPNETVIEKNNSEAEKHNETSTDTKTEDLTQDQEDEDETGSHPYICLIETFETPKELLKFTEIGATKPLENTKFVMVVTQNQILDMLQEVRNVKEVSLEPYCTQREFKRDITLLAISTRNTDYLLDVLKLKSQLLLLTEMFLNPKIVKIVFGASSVLATLQTLLHVYLVNIFDVEQARKILLEPPKNNYQLHQLIAHDYGVREKLTKASLNYYQSRPLSDRHIKFCRKNAHYLIYMYHDYKNKFILKDFEEYKIFLDYCREACKVVHKTEQLGKLQQLENELKVVHDCQKEVLKKLYDWNVKTAQMHNISVERVIPKGCLLNIVKSLPTNVDEITQISNSSYVKGDAEEVRMIILEAKTSYGLRIKTPKVQAAKRKVNNSPNINQKPKRLDLKRNTSNQNNSFKNQFNQNKPTTVTTDSHIQNPFANQFNQQNRPTTTTTDTFLQNPFDVTKLGIQSSTPINSFVFPPSSFQYNSSNNSGLVSGVPSFNSSNFTKLCETTKNLLAGAMNNTSTTSRPIEHETKRPTRDFGHRSKNKSRELDRLEERGQSQEMQYSRYDSRKRSKYDSYTRRY